MSVLVCVGCGLAEGHLPTCEGGGYAPRELLAGGQLDEMTHQADHIWLTERVPGCDYCLADPPSFHVRVTKEGRELLDEARRRYCRRQLTLEEYDAERARIIAAHSTE
ncbi:hypothetical protein [Nonomuraea sp. NPDC001023]|uniref:hypothetical protein n=1 Tax=unclassified Nonomuraea TaxID=2593643 RepID=UPI0033300215